MKGKSQVDIANHLQIIPELVSLDLKHIREESRKNLNNVIEKELPLAWIKARRSLQFIQVEALQVWEGAKTENMKLDALKVFGDAQEKEFALIINSHVLDECMQYVSSNSLKEVLTQLGNKQK